MSNIFLFPGQGSQRLGMGQELFGHFPELIKIADEILGYSIRSLCLEGPASRLSQTQYTQPALYVVNALTYLKTTQERNRQPDFLAGHSVGEYSALFAARVFDFATGLSMVKKRGELMSQARVGGMAAVVGLSQEKIAILLRENQRDSIDIANINAFDQVVISGEKQDIVGAQEIFEKNGARYVVLNVGGAFHSRYMEEAQGKFHDYIKDIFFSPLQIPVISNVTAQPYSDHSIAKQLAQQITKPVRWLESMLALLQAPAPEFFECGPGNTLLGLLKKIKNELPAPQRGFSIRAEDLGSAEFKKDHGVKYAYVSGSMVHGIASADLVIRMGKAKLLGFFGTGGLSLKEIENGILKIKEALGAAASFGVNLLANMAFPEMEQATVDLFLKHDIKRIEASAFMQPSPALVYFRLKGAKRLPHGALEIPHIILAKVSRPEVASHFLSPPPLPMIRALFDRKLITAAEAELAPLIPMCDDLCIEADSGGHTDNGVAYALMPAMLRLRDDLAVKYPHHKKIRLGAAGGIGSPQAVAAAFVLGADFVLTGSINQCTVEAGTSDLVKDMLQEANVQDMEMAPAGDMFEMGARVQVYRKGLFFPARANKLFELYRRHSCWEEIDTKIREQIETRYFKRSFDEVFQETEKFYAQHRPAEIEQARRHPKSKMAMVFKWYFHHSNELALNGSKADVVDFQIHCGPALGAFNQWAKGTRFESWRSRHVDELGEALMVEAAAILEKRFSQFVSGS